MSDPRPADLAEASVQERGDGAIYAFDLPTDGAGQPAPDTDRASMPASGFSFRWTHLDLNRPETAGWIESEVGDFAAELLTPVDTRPRLLMHEDGILLNLRGVNLNPGAEPEDMVSIRLWVDPKRVVSVRMRRLMAVIGLRDMVTTLDAPKSVGEFLSLLADQLTVHMENVVREMVDEVDGLEEESLAPNSELALKISDFRRRTIILKRYFAPQRDALQALMGPSVTLLSDDDRLALRDVVDRTTRLVEELDSLRERGVVITDQLAEHRAQQMNRHTVVLSIVAAIFLPMGFLTGLLGVNIGGIPGAGSPYAFAIFCAMLLTIAGGLYWFFRTRNWV